MQPQRQAPAMEYLLANAALLRRNVNMADERAHNDAVRAAWKLYYGSDLADEIDLINT